MSRLVAVLLLSLAAHAALLVGVVAALGFVAPRALFVDLVAGIHATTGGGSGGGGSSGEAGTRRRDSLPPEGSAPARRVPSRPSGSPTAPAARTAPDAAALARTPAEVPPPREERVHAPPEPAGAAGEPRTLREPPRANVEPPVARPPAAVPTPVVSGASASAGIASSAEPSGRTGGEFPSPGGGLSESGGGTGREGGARAGQGGSGSGGGRGAGVGAGQGSVVARAVPGDGGAALADYERYYALLRSRLHAALKYPTSARRRGLSGTVEIEVHVAASGEVDRAVVVGSSTHRLLDDAALEAAQGLRVPFPAGLPPAALRMRLPVVFELRDQP